MPRMQVQKLCLEHVELEGSREAPSTLTTCHAWFRTFRNALLLLAITRILSGATLLRKALLKNFLHIASEELVINGHWHLVAFTCKTTKPHQLRLDPHKPLTRKMRCSGWLVDISSQPSVDPEQAHALSW